MASRDYEEFIAALNARGVRYLIVGAHAVALHTRPRATKALDVLVDPAPGEDAPPLNTGRSPRYPAYPCSSVPPCGIRGE